MSILTDEDIRTMGKEDAAAHCEWCWGHDFCNCDNCAIHTKVEPSKEKLDVKK